MEVRIQKAIPQPQHYRVVSVSSISTVATSLSALHRLCDSPWAGCVRRSTIYMRGVNKQW